MREGVELQYLPGVVISVDRQLVAWPVPEERISVGPRLAFDLAVHAMVGNGSEAVELQLRARHWAYGGLYCGAGYQWAPESGAMVSAGLFLGSVSMAAGLLALPEVL